MIFYFPLNNKFIISSWIMIYVCFKHFWYKIMVHVSWFNANILWNVLHIVTFFCFYWMQLFIILGFLISGILSHAWFAHLNYSYFVILWNEVNKQCLSLINEIPFLQVCMIVCIFLLSNLILPFITMVKFNFRLVWIEAEYIHFYSVSLF